MKIALWSLLVLFLLGDAFFVLPFHLSDDKLTTSYYTNYKKDSSLLRNVFTDSLIGLQLNMPPGYDAMYKKLGDGKSMSDTAHHQLFINVSVFHNLDFTALCFPFYKLTTFNGVIPFYSIIKASNAPGMDSIALVGNIVVSGKIAIKGICTPLYARSLVENGLVAILKKEMGGIEADINRPPVKDTSINAVALPDIPLPVKMKRKRK